MAITSLAARGGIAGHVGSTDENVGPGSYLVHKSYYVTNSCAPFGTSAPKIPESHIQGNSTSYLQAILHFVGDKRCTKTCPIEK